MEQLEFFRSRRRAFSFLGYGAGKTAPTIVRLRDLVPPHRALVVTTVSGIKKWAKELATWGMPDWAISTLYGRRERRRAQFRKPHNVAVMNYEGMLVFGKALVDEYDVIVFDEPHRLKNPRAQISRAAAYLSTKAMYVYGLTGSPILETPLDAFGVVRAVNPQIFGTSYYAWRDKYFSLESLPKPDGRDGYPRWVTKPGAYEILREKMHSISFWKPRAQLDLAFPPQSFMDPIHVEIHPRAKELYDKVENDFILALHAGRMVLANVYPRLEKLCQLTRGWVYDDKNRAIQFKPNLSIEATGDYLESIRGQGSCVIWAVRQPEFSLLRDLCRELHFTFRMIHGTTGPAERERVLDQFNNGGCEVLIAHPRCIGECVDIYSPFSLRFSYRWSAQEYGQSIGRFSRLNSVAGVDVYYTDLVAPGTVDESIMESIRSKRSLLNSILEKRSLPWRPDGSSQHELRIDGSTLHGVGSIGYGEV